MGDVPPVDWSAVQVKSDLGGVSRFPAEAALKPTAWRCPSCGAENVSVFEYGCPVCHAGEPGKHVGVDPITPVAKGGATSPFQDSAVGAAFNAFAKRVQTHGVMLTPEGWAVVEEAFLEGYEKGKADVLTIFQEGTKAFRSPVPPPDPRDAQKRVEPKRRGAIISTPALAQTVLTALSTFRDGFLAGLSDEDRELWASNKEINALLSSLELIAHD